MADRVASDAESSRRDRTKNEATRKRSAATKEQTKRPGLFGGIWLFFKQVIDEMKKVTYPTGSETWTYFLVVVVFVAAIMLFAGLLDFGFGKLSALIFGWCRRPRPRDTAGGFLRRSGPTCRRETS